MLPGTEGGGAQHPTSAVPKQEGRGRTLPPRRRPGEEERDGLLGRVPGGRATPGAAGTEHTGAFQNEERQPPPNARERKSDRPGHLRAMV